MTVNSHPADWNSIKGEGEMEQGRKIKKTTNCGLNLMLPGDRRPSGDLQ